MKVAPWEVTRANGVVRFTLALQWEDRQQDDSVAWIEWPEAHAEMLVPDAQSALLAAYPAALWYGERRLRVEGDVCPRLADNTRTAMSLLTRWSPSLRPLALELSERLPLPAAPALPRATALCLSGGVDALAALRRNMEQLPSGHPGRYTVGLFAFGLNSYDFAAGEAVPDRLRASDVHAARLTPLAEGCGLQLVRVAFNFRTLYPTFDAWGTVAHTSPLAAMGHAMRRRIGALAIANAGTGVEPGIVPSPLLDPLYASYDLDVHSVHAAVTRLEKVRLVAQWPEALAALRVCYLIHLPAGEGQNCGQCEKCVRTMVQLIAVGGGALARAPFPTADVTAADIDRTSFDGLAARIFFSEAMPALAAQGRDDLVRAIQRGLERSPSRANEPGWRRWWTRRRPGRS